MFYIELELYGNYYIFVHLFFLFFFFLLYRILDRLEPIKEPHFLFKKFWKPAWNPKCIKLPDLVWNPKILKFYTIKNISWQIHSYYSWIRLYISYYLYSYPYINRNIYVYIYTYSYIYMSICGLNYIY